MKGRKRSGSTARKFVLADVGRKAERSREENLERLFCTTILPEFVNENNGQWDHQKWLDLCDKVTKEGYAPIDFDQMGLMLEKLKAVWSKVRRSFWPESPLWVVKSVMVLPEAPSLGEVP